MRIEFGFKKEKEKKEKELNLCWNPVPALFINLQGGQVLVASVEAFDEQPFAFLQLPDLAVGHVEPDEQGNMYENEKDREANEEPEVEVIGELLAPERAHDRVPHAEQTDVEDGAYGVLVKRGQIGDGGQRAVYDPFERDRGQKDCVGGLQAVLGQLAVHREDGERRDGDQKDERVGVEEVVAGLARTVTGGH